MQSVWLVWKPGEDSRSVLSGVFASRDAAMRWARRGMLPHEMDSAGGFYVEERVVGS